MIDDTNELARKMVRVADEVLERRAQAAKAANGESFALLLCRNLSWAGAALGFVFAFGLSCLRWADAVIPAVGVIHWFVVGMGASFLGAVTLQMTINQRRTAAGQRRITERMDAAAAKLREEIHDARPADAEDLARLAAMHEATQELIRQLQGQVDDLRKAVSELTAEVCTRDDAFVDALSEQEDWSKTNGHKISRLVRPSSPRAGDRRT